MGAGVPRVVVRDVAGKIFLFGDRQNTTYTTDNGSTTWQYADYVSAGQPQAASVRRLPQTMRQLDSGGNPTAEEFHYQYDALGRLMASTFATQPASGYSASSGNPYYTIGELASSRACIGALSAP